jgi:hypothetical protein
MCCLGGHAIVSVLLLHWSGRYPWAHSQDLHELGQNRYFLKRGVLLRQMLSRSLAYGNHGPQGDMDLLQAMQPKKQVNGEIGT